MSVMDILLPVEVEQQRVAVAWMPRLEQGIDGATWDLDAV